MSKRRNKKKKQAGQKPHASSSPEVAGKKKHRPGKWRRRAWRTLIVLFVAAIVLRIAVPFVVPVVFDRVASGYGLSCEYEDMDLSLLSGDVRLWHLRLTPRPEEGAPSPSGEPAAAIVHLEYAHVDFDVSALFTGALRVHRVEVDGLDVRVERDAAGEFLLAKYLPAPAPASGTETEAEQAPADDEPEPADLRSPVRIDAARLQHVRIHVIDPSVEPNVDTWIDLGVRVSDIGVPERDARLQILVHGPDLVDRLAVEGDLHAEEERLEANISIDVSGLDPMPAAGWLRPLGLRPTGATLAFETRAKLEAGRNEDNPFAIDTRVKVAATEVRCGADVAARIDEVRAEVRGIGSDRVVIPEVWLDGIRGVAERRPDQALRVAGFDLVPPGQPITPGTAGVPGPVGTESAEDSTKTAPVTLQLDRLIAGDIALRFVDRAVEPSVDLDVKLDELRVQELATDAVDEPTHVTIRGSVPGVFESGEVTLDLKPLAPIIVADSRISAGGISLSRLRPYLQAAGLESTLKDGTLRCRIGGTAQVGAEGVHASLDVTEVKLSEDGEKLALDAIAVRDVFLDTSGAAIRIGGVEVRGGRLPVRRAADGSIHVAGVRTVSTNTPLATAAKPGEAPESRRAGQPPAKEPGGGPAVATTGGTPPPVRLELGALRCRDLALQFDDEAVTEKRSFATENVEFDLLGFAIGGAPGSEKQDIAELRLELGITNVVQKLAVAGSVTTRPGPLDIAVKLDVAGDVISVVALAPYLAAAGIEPTLKDGQLRANLTATAKAGDAPGTLVANAALRDVSFGSATADPFVTLAELRAEDVVVRREGIRTARILIDKPVLRIEREASGALAVAGVRIVPRPATEPESDGGPRAPSAPAAPEEARAGAGQSAVALDRFELRGATVAWSDATIEPAVQTALVVDVDADRLSSVPGSGKMPFGVTLRVANALDTLKISGAATIDDKGIAADARIDARGLRAGPLARYLPAGVTVDLENGRFGLALQASLDPSTTAGSAAFRVDDFVFQDGDQPPLAACKEIRLSIPKIDTEGRELRIAEVAARGIELTVARRSADSIALLGMTLAQPEPAGTGTGESSPKDAPERPLTNTEPGAQSKKDGRSNTDERPKNVRAVPAALRRGKPAFWRVDLDKLDLELARLHFVDHATGRAGRPLDARMRLQNAAPWVLLDKEPEELAPLRLRITGAADPVVEALAVNVEIAPFQTDAIARVDVDVSGIRGATLAEVLPSIRDLDLSDLREGKFTAKAEAQLSLRRRHPADFDLSRGFGARLAVTDVALTDTPGGEVLVGVDSVNVEAPRVTLGGPVHVASVEIGTVRGRVKKDATGLHAAGMRIPEAANAPGANTDSAGEKPAPDAAQPKGRPTVPPQQEVSAATPEFKIDQITIQGIDFIYRDESVDPPMTVPLTGLDVEVSKWTTKALTEDRAIKFSLNLEAGEIDLPKRHEASSALAGALAGVGKLVAGQGDEIEIESRRLLDELTIAGRIRLHPSVRGRIRTSLRGLELGALSGPAAQSGVSISDGVFDAGIETRIEGPQAMVTRANFTLGHLSIDEKPGGPISTYLKLPAPLQSVVFALRDDAGEIGIPLNLATENGDVSASEIATIAVTTLSSLIVKAVAASPFRVAGSVTSLVGLTGGETPVPGALQQDLTFAPAVAAPDPRDLPKVQAIVSALADDDKLVVELRHRFGKDDMARAELLANPSQAQARSLVARLRQRRSKLNREHARLRAEVLAQLAVGRSEEADRSVVRVRRVTGELGEIEDALDRLLALLRPGAERRKDRRTMRMAMGIGKARLESVREALLQAGGPDLLNRIEIRPARVGKVDTDRGGVRMTPKVREVRKSKEEAASDAADDANDANDANAANAANDANDADVTPHLTR